MIVKLAKNIAATLFLLFVAVVLIGLMLPYMKG